MRTLPGRDRRADMLVIADAFFENLRRDDCEYGGWGIDPKRPFGNSYVDGDMCEMLWGRDREFTEDETDYAASLYDDLGEFLRKEWQRFRRCYGEPK